MDNDKMPTQESCDPNIPEEFAVWAMVGIPGMRGAPLPFPVGYLKQVSRRLWDAGFRWHPEHQTIRYKRPAADDPHWLTNPGSWVPIDEPVEQETLKDWVASLPLGQRQAIANAVLDTGKE